MGQVKKMMMDLQDRGDWPDGLQDKYVCTHHFDDPYLNALIKRYREEGKKSCSYCGRRGTVCSLQTFIENVTWKLHLYFDDVDNTSLLYADSFYDDENEIIPGFKRVGEYVAPKEAEYFESTYDLLGYVGLITDDEELNKDIESTFETEQWIERDILHEDYRRNLMNKWQAFSLSVTHSRRYTFLATPEFLPLVKGEDKEKYTDILTSLRRLIIEQKLVKTLPEGTGLFRARRVEDAAKRYEFNDITSSPDTSALSNQMSPAGVSMFYASFNAETAAKECVGDESHILLGSFQTKKALNILDLTNIPGPSFWMDGWQENQFLHSFNREITKKLDRKDKKQLQYITTQVFTEFLRYMVKDADDARLDGMIYGSSKTREQNIVLFCNQHQSQDFVTLKECKIL